VSGLVNAKATVKMHEYAIVVELSENGTNWCGYSPDVPGVIATDETAEATADRLRGAIELHVQVMADLGMSLPESRSLVRMINVAV
jgi:predicted RNase H-like HicB family nuclease